MANINQISPDGGTTVYDIEDPTARSSINSLTPRVGIAEGKITTLQEQMLSVEDDLDGLGTASTKNSTSVVTESSDLVESGAVKDIVGWGNKNVLPFPYKDTTKTVSGITFTVIDQSVSVSGLLSGVAPEFNITEKIADDRYAGLILSCGVENTADVFMRIRIGKHSTGAFIRELKGDNLTIPTLGDDEDYFIAIRVEQTTQISPAVVFYPMISKDGGAYEPYHASVEDTLRDAEVVEGLNLFEAKMPTTTINGITVTNNGDGTFTISTVSGGATATTTFRLDQSDAINGTDNLKTWEKGQYYVSGIPSTISFVIMQNETWKIFGQISGSGILTRPNTLDNCFTYIRIEQGTVLNTTIKPQIEVGTQPTPFKPYYIPLKDVVPTKADNSVIGTVEDGTTASQAYAVREHFIRDGAFCTCTQAISQGGSFTLGTNYTAGDVADELTSTETSLTTAFTSDYNIIRKCGNVVYMNVYLTGVTYTAFVNAIGNIPIGYRPKERIRGVGMIANNDGTIGFSIYSDGNIQLADSVNNNNVDLVATWVI